MEQQKWKDVVGYEGYYVVSNDGIVKSVERKVTQGHWLRTVKEKIKTIHYNAYGYPCVTLCKNGQSKSIPLHIIIAKAFIQNPENKFYVDHIDTNKNNFYIGNLRWVTAKENANNPLTLQHCKQNTYIEEVIKRRLATSKKRENITAPKDIYQYTLQGELLGCYSSSKEAERLTQVNASAIRSVCNKKRYSAGGFLWSYQLEEMNFEKPVHTNAKAVLQYDKNGEFIKEWHSLAEVCKVYGSTPSNLSKRIKKAKFRGKYIWKFKE